MFFTTFFDITTMIKVTYCITEIRLNFFFDQIQSKELSNLYNYHSLNRKFMTVVERWSLIRDSLMF